MKGCRDNPLRPAVSIIIPAKNAEEHLGSCLKSIHALEYPKECVEVIVADNGSTDKTSAIARERGAKVIDARGLKLGGVRNRGASVAEGAILAFTDADIVLGPKWLAAAIESLNRPDVGAVGGGCLAPASGTWVEKAWPNRATSFAGCIEHLAGSSFILRRAVFESVGGFQEELCAAEDDDLSRRIRQKQLRLVAIPDCAVVHLGYPKTLTGILRRQVWLGSSLTLWPNPFNQATLLTYVFLCNLMSAPLAMLLSERSKLFVANLVFIAAVPLAAAARKAAKGSEFYSPAGHLLRLWVIYFFYYVGKGIAACCASSERLRRSSYSKYKGNR